MSRIAAFSGLIAASAIVLASAACGDVVRQGRAPVFLTVDSIRSGNNNVLLSDVLSNSGSIFNDLVTVTLRVTPKNLAPTVGMLPPTANNAVTISRYRITFRRADGRNTPGVDVPFGFDGAATATINVNSTTSVNIEIVRHVAKAESPLVQLAQAQPVITTIADVTFYGTDLVGNEVTATGSIQVDFGDFAG